MMEELSKVSVLHFMYMRLRLRRNGCLLLGGALHDLQSSVRQVVMVGKEQCAPFEGALRRSTSTVRPYFYSEAALMLLPSVAM